VQLEYTYTEEPDGWLVGSLDAYPEQLTQGKDIAELEIMLLDLYKNIQDEAAILAELAEIERREKPVEHKGILEISEALA